VHTTCVLLAVFSAFVKCVSCHPLPVPVIDYCSFGNDSCEHECVSVLKGFNCRCKDGYTLNDDKKTCTS